MKQAMRWVETLWNRHLHHYYFILLLCILGMTNTELCFFFFFYARFKLTSAQRVALWRKMWHTFVHGAVGRKWRSTSIPAEQFLIGREAPMYVLIIYSQYCYIPYLSLWYVLLHKSIRDFRDKLIEHRWVMAKTFRLSLMRKRFSKLCTTSLYIYF